jgi:hypothetical protein
MGRRLAIVLFSVFLLPATASGGELGGMVALELTQFMERPLYEGQDRNTISVMAQPEYFHVFSDGSSITIAPFLRYDSSDPERTHFDIREMNFHLVRDSIEIRTGIGRVFWGATEFVHLVDVINQTDLVESIDGEEKLGQPMIQFIRPFKAASVEFFVLPYFRERTFPGKGGRFRPSLQIDTGNALYEDDEKERHVDFAARFTATAGVGDLGLSYFRGTGRDPTFIPSLDSTGTLILVPYYEQTEQIGTDIQAVFGPWLFKLEGFKRTGQGDRFYAASSGLEYTISGIFGSVYDLGAILEYAHDSRGVDSASAFQNDIMLGLRLALNDTSGTDALFGYIHDIDYSSKVVRFEGSRRIGNNIKLNLESGLFLEMDRDDILYDLRNDDYIQMTLSYYL